MLSQRPAKAPHPLHTGERVRTPTQKHQVPVAQLQQIPDGDGRPRLIVRHHIAALLPWFTPRYTQGCLQQVGVLGLALPGQGRDQHASICRARKFSMARSSRPSSWRELLNSTRYPFSAAVSSMAVAMPVK